MEQHEHHEELVAGLVEQLKPIFDESAQSVYVYLDDVHKACNNNFAKLLGYASPEAWAAVDDSFPTLVTEKSQETLISAYRDAMEKLVGSTIEVTWNKKDGGTIKTTVILVPIIYQNHALALHFIS